MTEKKITKKEMFNAMLNFEGKVADNKMFVDFIKHEIELLERKNGGSKKPTEQQETNEKIKEKILEILNKPMTATQVMKAVEPYFPDLKQPLTNQRISALLRALGDKGTGEVDKYTDKRVTYFKKVEVEAEG